MRNNDNPIQELKPFRIGLDNLTEDNEINSNYSNDLHNCSDDLSNEGSIREEREHADFARRKKEEVLKRTTLNYNWKTEKNSAIKNNKKSNLIAILIVIWVIWGSVAEVVENFEATTSFSPEPDYIEYEEMVETQEMLFEDSKHNIIINSTILSDSSIILEITNLNYYVFNNIKIQTIFYDTEDTPMKICENNINTLFESGTHFCKIIDAPENYERFEFLITQPYVINSKNVDYQDLTLNASLNYDNDFDIEFTNNSENELDNVDLVILYYYDGKIVDIKTDSLYDIKPGRTEFDTIYNFNDENSYNSARILVNDIYIYE